MTMATAPAISRLTGVKPALRLDAVASGGVGVLLLAFGWALDGPLGAPLALTVPAGAFLLVFAATLLGLAARAEVPRGAVREVAAFNVFWVAASVVLVVAGWFDLTALGVAFVLAQAAVVGLFAVLQFASVRR
jgi:hypothetical protein